MFNWIGIGYGFEIGYWMLELNLKLLVYGKWSGIKLDNGIDLIYSNIGFHSLHIK
jgi:hypothetical protein